MNRRKFLAGSLAVGAAAGLSRFPFLGRDFVRTARADPSVIPYPVFALYLRGGLDPAMHMVATPNGRFGNVDIANRMSGTTDIKETPLGIRYFVPAMAPPGKTDIEAHLGDIALLRAVKIGGCHGKIAALWMGDVRPNATSLADYYERESWGANLASQLRTAGFVVPKPCAVAHQTMDYSVEPYLDFLNYAPLSPNPAAAPERLLSVDGFFKSISSTGLPPYERQLPAYGVAKGLDNLTYSAETQPEIMGHFKSANTSADDTLKAVFSGPPWPPPQNVKDALDIQSDSGPDLTGNPPYNYIMAIAHQAFSKNLSHVIMGACGGGVGWDTHENNLNGQIACGQDFWPLLGKFLALMKNTPSPLVAGKSLFDTTNIWVMSEMGRTPGADRNVQATDGTGHFENAAVMLFGGRFKRGVAIGGLDNEWYPAPVNPATGNAAGGIVPGINNVIATVIKAAGGDPAAYTKAAPFDALLDMSL
jgi:uncharacterized protein (DUF1501 family)